MNQGPLCTRAVLLALLPCVLMACQSVGGDPKTSLSADEGAANTAADINTQLGVEHMRQGNYEVALNRLERAIAMDNSYAPAYDALGLLYTQLKRPEEAAGYFKKAVELDPQNAGAMNNYGQLLCSMGKAEEGVQWFDRALENPLYQTPENAATNAGLCLLSVNDEAGAEARFEQALTFNPNMTPALVQICRISFERGDALRARAFLQRYTALVKPGPQALLLGVRIERALGDRDAEFNYAIALRDGFPDTPEAQELARLQTQTP